MSDITPSSTGPSLAGTSPSGTTTRLDDQRALRILAKSVYRELKSTGYERSDIVGFTNELLELLTSDCRNPTVS